MYILCRPRRASLLHTGGSAYTMYDPTAASRRVSPTRTSMYVSKIRSLCLVDQMLFQDDLYICLTSTFQNSMCPIIMRSSGVASKTPEDLIQPDPLSILNAATLTRIRGHVWGPAWVSRSLRSTGPVYIPRSASFSRSPNLVRRATHTTLYLLLLLIYYT